MNSEDFFSLPCYLIGSGNVATHLGMALKSKGLNFDMVWSRNSETAALLSQKIKSEFTDNIDNISNKKAIYLLCIPDNAISEIAKIIGVKDSVLIHTSGSTNISVVENHTINAGVFYPLQTFTKFKPQVNFKNLPIFIETSNQKVNELLVNWCNLLGSVVYHANSAQRIKIHITAVFANNFTNHILSIAQEIAEQNKINFELFKPLISETFEKIKYYAPKEIQTGPAIRNDDATIEKHLKSLSDNPVFAKIYSFVSDSIKKMHAKEN